ncbi:MAG: hypothetical protein ACI9KS_000882 [Sulfitobacter sp.]|jgi:hypothetical protein
MKSEETQNMRNAVLTVATLIGLMGTGSLVLVANSAERLHGTDIDTRGYGVIQTATAATR